jgi:hypothetical protein
MIVNYDHTTFIVQATGISGDCKKFYDTDPGLEMKWHVPHERPRALFKKLYFLRNLQMGQLSLEGLFLSSLLEVVFLVMCDPSMNGL